MPTLNKTAMNDELKAHVDARISIARRDIHSIYTAPWRLLVVCFDIVYQVSQICIILLFKPNPPKDDCQPSESPFGRVAVIGAGLTGVSSAAHCIAHNFDVVLYDENPSVGGIWSHVNSTSGLQINSMIYRFHPAVFWKEGFPRRDEILGEISKIWKQYKLESRTRFNTKVTKVSRATNVHEDEEKGRRKSKWVINDGEDGEFDAVICAVGTCGKPMKLGFDGQEDFENAGGRVVHSSELDTLSTGDNSGDEEASSIDSGEGMDDGQHESPLGGNSQGGKGKNEKQRPLSVEGKTVIIVGSGASGVEAAEWAVEKGAAETWILARDDKWIIPRNVVFDTILSMQPFGREMPLSVIPEWFIRKFHYGDLSESVAPLPGTRGLFEGTPVVNDSILHHIRNGLVRYVRCDTKRFTSEGVLVKKHSKQAEEVEVKGDIAILATGFERPGVDFLPDDLFPSRYERPNLYLQNFPTEDWTVLLTNAAYSNAIGTVGHFHIGIYTRILLTFLLDKGARPEGDDMKLWVDVLRFIKRGSRGGALGFFTYMELTIWLLTFHLFRPDRLRWIFFVMQGWGVTYKDAARLKVE